MNCNHFSHRPTLAKASSKDSANIWNREGEETRREREREGERERERGREGDRERGKRERVLSITLLPGYMYMMIWKTSTTIFAKEDLQNWTYFYTIAPLQEDVKPLPFPQQFTSSPSNFLWLCVQWCTPNRSRPGMFPSWNEGSVQITIKLDTLADMTFGRMLKNRENQSRRILIRWLEAKTIINNII